MTLNAKALEAAQRAADEAYMASDENAVHDAVVAGISAYLSTTSAGVTEEQVERALHARVPGGAEVWEWLPQKDAFTPHETARDIIRSALMAVFSGRSSTPELQCAECGGQGLMPGYDCDCPACNGTGKARHLRRSTRSKVREA